MAFNFRLERVLRYRKFKVRQLQIELGQRLQEKLYLEAQLSKLSEQKLSYLRQLGERLTGNLQIAEVNVFLVDIQITEQQISSTQQQLRSVEDALEKIREKLKLAQKEEKVITSVQQRRFARYLKEMESKEQAYADEVAGYLYIRKLRGNNQDNHA